MPTRRKMDNDSIRRNARGASAFAAVLTLALSAFLSISQPANASLDPALTVVSSGWVSPSTGLAFGATAVRAPNGDILVTYNTGAETEADVRIMLTRSTNDGQSWSSPQELASQSPNYFAGEGLINSGLGMQTLSNGTILWPYTESKAHTKWTDRESVTFVARSADSGITWTGQTTPITLPVPMSFNANYGRIVELANGTLLMPVWGTPTRTTETANPVPWQAGILRSTNSGATWSSYNQIAVDAISPPVVHNGTGQFPSAVTETTVTPMRDGRLLAMIRYDTTLGAGRYFYQSYSNDGGITWSTPVASLLQGRGGELASAPCTAYLGTGKTKLIMGHLDHTLADRAAIAVSFDGGVTWGSRTPLQRPTGAPTNGWDIYTSFVPLPNERMLVVYGIVTPPPAGQSAGIQRVAYNVVQDSAGTDCQQQLANAEQQQQSTIGWFLLSGDRSVQPWPYGTRAITSSTTTTVASVLTQTAGFVTCTGNGAALYRNGIALNPNLSLAQNGVQNGDELTIRGSTWSGTTKGGFNELDVYPDKRPLFGFPTYCDYPFALDYKSRSTGASITLTAGQHVTALNIRDRDSSTRLTAADYKLWASNDNHNWTQITGWQFQASVVNGRLIHSFTGLSLTNRYMKIGQNKSDTAFTFVISSIRSDIWATIT